MRSPLRTVLIAVTLLAAFIAPVTVSAGNDVDIHGFLSQGYMKSSDNNFLTNSDEGSYEFNEFGLNFQYFANDRLSIGAQLGGRDLGTVGNDKVGLNWAYGDYRWREWLGVRAGIMKGANGLYAESRDVDALRTWILLPQSIYPELRRDASEGLKGVSLYGTLDLKGAGMLKYSTLMGNLQMDTDSGTAQYIIMSEDAITDISSIDFGKLYMGTLRWQTPLEGLLLSTEYIFIDGYTMTVPVSIAIDGDGDPATPLNVVTTDYPTPEVNDVSTMFYGMEYTFQNLILAAEMTVNKRETAGMGESKMESWYVSAAYRFLDWFEAGTYYSYSEEDSDGSGADNELKDICMSARFDIGYNMTFKLETHIMDGLYGVYPGDDGTRDDSWMLYAAKVSYNF